MEIEYVALYQIGDSTNEARKNLLIEQREELLAKINELKETLEYLNKKIERYDEIMVNSECLK